MADACNMWIGFVLVCASLHKAVATADPAIYRLYRNLTDNYLPLHPRRNSREVVNIGISFYLHSIMDLDSRNGALMIQGDFIQLWKDDFLVWNPAMYDDTELLLLNARDIWLPDVSVFNSMSKSRSEFFDSSKEYPVRVWHDGTVYWGFTALVESSCNVVMTLFPFDIQLCIIRYGSSSSDSRTIQIFPLQDHVDGVYYAPNGQFEIISNATYFNPFGDVNGSDPYYPSVTIELKLARRPMYYIVNMLLPCVVLSMLSLLAFCLPCNSGERVSLQITVLLSFVIFQVMLAEFIPRSATDIPILSWLILSIMILNAVSLAANVLVIHIYDKDSTQAMSKMCHQVIFGCLAKVVMCQSFDRATQQYSHPDHICPVELTTPNRGNGETWAQQSKDANLPQEILREIQNYLKPGTVTEWHLAANVLDRVFLVLFFMVFLGLGIYSSVYGGV